MQPSSSTTQFRFRRLLIGGLLLCWPPIWFRLLESGTLRTSSRWLAGLLVFSLIGSILGGVAFVGNGLGLLTSEVVAHPPLGRAPTLRRFLTVYIGSLLFVGVLAFGAAILGANWLRSAAFGVAIIFLLAAARRPWWLFATIRRVGWFSLIEEDRAISVVLAVLGSGVALFGIFAPAPPIQ
jgi:hypothetical protein